MSKLMDEQQAFLIDFCKLINFAVFKGFQVTAGELLRPIEMQKIYVSTGRSKTLNSKHIQKLAGDLNLFKNYTYIQSYDELKVLGNFWENLSDKNRWGGNFHNFKDLPHFERNI